ncbi:AN1-like Zinc finger, partial [Oesophagostomum dentatum]
IVCDLTNEFRKQKVRRHRHPPALSTCRQRARSKPRVAHREGSSSDETEASQTSHVVFALPVRRGVSTRTVRSVAIRGGAARCSVCAFRINSAFNCRCGKTLCSRHRAAQSHTCSKIRAKLQQVSD